MIFSLRSGKKLLKKTCAIFTCLFLVILIPFTVLAYSPQFQSVPYSTYSHQRGSSAPTPVFSRPMFIPTQVISGTDLEIGAFRSPESLAAGPDGMLYVLDSGNGRIVVLDSFYRLEKEITEFASNDETFDITSAKGLFINQNGNLVISDTEHSRILISDSTGFVSNVLLRPTSELIPEDYRFVPIKAVQDTRGFTFALSRGSFYGALIYTPDGEFGGFYGANRVPGTILSAMGKLFDLIFTSDKKRESRVLKLPYEFNDVSIDETNFIYTVTANPPSTTGQIKKLSPGGENVLNYKQSFRSFSAEYYSFIDPGGYIRDNGRQIRNEFYALSIDKSGYIYALDTTHGKVFVYDQECNLLTTFGGGLNQGYQHGTFLSASAIVVLGSDVVVSDSSKGTLTVFSITPFGDIVKKAQSLTIQGDYEKAFPIWEDVIKQDRFYQIAYRGLAKSAMASDDQKTSLAYAKLGYDKDAYALAFEYIRRDFIYRNFPWLFISSIIFISAIIAILIYTTKRESIVLIKNLKIRCMVSSLIHPIESFGAVKYEKQGSLGLALIVVFLFYSVSTLRDVYTGFMYSSYDPLSYNAVFTLLGTAGMVCLWTVSNWGINIFFEGKGRMAEIFIVSSYAMIPLILARTLNLILSQFLLPAESSILGLILSIGNLAMVIIMVFGMMVVHEYTFPRAFGTSVLSISGMGLMAFLIVLILTLFQDLISFLMGLFMEISLRFY